MRIEAIPLFRDNYAWLVADDATGAAAVVDPADPDAVLLAARAAGVKPSQVWCTHHHPDHSAGNVPLRARLPGLEVVGATAEAGRVPGMTRGVSAGDSLRLGALAAQVLSVPCHTRGHVAFLVEDALFCGDTLFVGGCGRFFEGDAADMYHALFDVFGALPPSTRVFCGHEYTVTNLRFALTLEPDNAALHDKLAWALAERAAGRPTVPSTLAEERTYNPYLRVDRPEVQAAVGASDPVSAMAAVRRLKDAFKG